MPIYLDILRKGTDENNLTNNMLYTKILSISIFINKDCFICLKIEYCILLY